MKIEKKKVTGNSQLSQATKIGVASLLGMTSVYITACVNDAESDVPMVPVGPNSSDASQGPESASSSSFIDIPLSHERLSSAAEEALSSSAKILNSSSSIAETPSSSSEVPESSSQAAESSSSFKNESSSSSAPSSSSIQTQSSSSINFPFERQCEMVDSTGIKVIMCRDDDRGMAASMVSTYEMSDMS